eukprot:gene2409-4678_t
MCRTLKIQIKYHGANSLYLEISSLEMKKKWTGMLLYLTLLASLTVVSPIDITEDYSTIQAARRIAEFTYENQKIERGKQHKVSTALAVFGANWPCLWGEEVTGDMETWEKHFDKYTDGWKFTCGLRRIPAPCVVYSLGSCGNMAFEKGLLAANPACTIHVFDKDSYGIDEWFPNPTDRKKVHFHRVFIGNQPKLQNDPPVQTIAHIMKKHEHTHIDILKMDIEGAEWDILVSPLPSIGQLLVELHLSDGPLKGLSSDRHMKEVTRVFDNIERHGLRLFHKEVNARWDMTCIEFAFIQENWSPSNKTYISTL